jgi:hypothetical protein
MRFPFRPIFWGLVIGALLFFVPFGFPFFFFFFFFFLVARFFFRPWGWRRGHWRQYNDFRNDTIPIDGYGHPHQNSNEPERTINIR